MRKILNKFLFVTALIIGIGSQLQAAATLDLTQRLTWDVMGLDSNKVNDGINIFPLGYRYCNNGEDNATNVVATLSWTTANTYIEVVGGAGVGDTISVDVIEAGECYDFYFNIEITRDANAYDVTRSYVVSVTADGVTGDSTPIGTDSADEIYVERLVSQNRNSINSITGDSVVYKGGTYTFVLDGSTATNGYEQLESYIDFPNNIYRILSVDATYTAGTTTDDDVYIDSCIWISDPANTDYLSCNNKNKSGGNIELTYQVQILGTGSASVSAMIYDFSGSSFHYNADYGTITKAIDAIEADFGDLPSDATHTYGTTIAEDGARHVIGGTVNGVPANPLIFLGAEAPDYELGDGVPSDNADYDDTTDTADEDGITFLAPMVAGASTDLNVTASAECANVTCNFSAWIDFNQDGDFDDPGEQIFTDSVVSGGDTTLTYPVPAGTDTTQPMFSMFRLTTDTGITSKGLASDGEVETFKIDDPSTLPVTISYVYPINNGAQIEVDFSTSTETSNAGFNIYAVKGKKWTKLNDELIPGAFNSFEPKEYHVSLDIPEGLKIKKIGIAGVDFDGNEDRHGPFKLEKESGAKTTVVPVNWKKINKQVKADRKARKAAKKANKKATKALFKDQVINFDISENAVYRVTHDNLIDAGINLIGQKAKNIAISFRGEGIARHLDGLNKKGKWTKNSVIEFIGTTLNASDALYLDRNVYQLVLDKKLVVKSEGIDPVTTKELVFETNNKYAWNIPGDDPFYDTWFYTRGADKPGHLARTFKLSEVPEGDFELTVNLSAVSNGDHHILVSLNGTQIAEIEAEGWVELPLSTMIHSNMLKVGSNEISFTAIGKDNEFDIIVYDKLVLSFDDGNALEEKSPVITLTDKVSKKSIKPTKGTNYVIISHPMFMSETLDRYINARKAEGWNIQLVNVEDIYATYGYGMATPDAIKSYLKVAKRKGVTHVQLVGAANYDYHDYLGLGSVNFIGSLYVHTGLTTKYTPSDASLVVNETGLPQLAIGRWPVRTAEDLEAVVNKSLAWKNSGQSESHSALFIADENEADNDFSAQMDRLAKQFNESGQWDMTHVYLSDYLSNENDDETVAVTEARKDIMQSLNDGASITTYSGHSSLSTWSFKGLLKQDDIASITNVEHTTIALPLACYTTYADSPRTTTLAHQLLAAGENGAVAVYGAATLSYFADNSASATKVIDYLLKGETLGEAIRRSKVDLGANYSDIIRNSNLLGDVTIQID